MRDSGTKWRCPDRDASQLFIRAVWSARFMRLRFRCLFLYVLIIRRSF